MANWNGWAVAAGLAGALVVFGTARAQTPGAPDNMGTSQQGARGSSTMPENGGRAGWSGSSATEPGQQPSAAPGETAAGSQGASASAPSGKIDKKLQDDLQKLHADNQAEVHMGQMGEQQATSPEVKDFAQKLQEDHQKLDDKVTQTAQAQGISLEGKAAEAQQKDAQKEMKKLEGKTGESFDKAFVSMMAKDHEKDIKAMEKAAKQAKKDKQPELAALFDQAVTGMKGHLSTAKKLERTVGRKSARTSGASSTGSMGSSGSSSAGSSGSSGSSSGTRTSGSPRDTGSTGSTNPGH